MDNLRCLAENSPDALAAFTREHELLFANRRFLDLSANGADEKDIGPGDGIAELGLPKGVRSDLEQCLAAVLRSGEERRFTCWEVLGNTRHRLSGRVVPTPGGDFLVEIRLTRSEAEDGLDSEAAGTKLFFEILDRFPAFVYMQRQDYTVAYANKRVRDLYGRTESRLCYEVFGGRTSPCPTCPTFEVFKTGKSVEWEFVDDMGRTFHIYDYPYEDETGKAMVVELGIDVTELKRVEKELFEARKLRAIGVLAGGMAHDLNNNLVPIIFNIDHALNRAMDQTNRDTLSEALQAAYRAAKLVEQVLEYSRQHDIKRSHQALSHIVRQEVDSFSAKLPQGISVDVDLGDGQDVILANEAQLAQVLQNLLNNAMQAMPDGGAISISMGRCSVETQHKAPHPDLKPGNYVSLRICDTGNGMERENLDRIFEPFFTTRKGKGGNGMGLALVYAIVNSGGGCIKVDSTPGMGTSFTLYFPMVSGSPSHPMLKGEPCILHSQGGRILLVDDDASARQVMARTMRDAGFTVDEAGSGAQGMDLFTSNSANYGLVLVDQSMPGMTGLALAERMLARAPSTRIVICTGYVEPELETQALSGGVSGFALKPMSPFVLVDTVRRHCR